MLKYSLLHQLIEFLYIRKPISGGQDWFRQFGALLAGFLIFDFRVAEGITQRHISGGLDITRLAHIMGRGVVQSQFIRRRHRGNRMIRGVLHVLQARGESWMLPIRGTELRPIRAEGMLREVIGV